jgi:hypothetical protein
MTFEIAALERELRQDNSHYERFRQSSLHSLVGALRGGFPQPSPANIATIIKTIPLDKWRKYKNAKKYLMKEIPGIAPLVRDYLGQIVEFHTVSMRKRYDGGIVHTVGWRSSTGNLEDLFHVETRESVQWGNPAVSALEYLALAYRQGGSHNGNLTASANTGENDDGHELVGPFQHPASMRFRGPGEHRFVMNQTYEYSDDGCRTWNTIPNSAFRITRTLGALNNYPLFTVRKTSVSTGHSCQNSLHLR